MYKNYFEELSGNWDDDNNYYVYNCTVVDDDFTETIYESKKHPEEIICEIYTRRNLNLAKNLFLFMLNWLETEGVPLSEQIDNYYKIFRQYPNLQSELNKYMMFI